VKGVFPNNISCRENQIAIPYSIFAITDSAKASQAMSRNPFLDLGFSREEATALHIRSQLAATLEHYITRKGWSQAEAAKTLKVPQPTISKIVNGNIEKLSIEFLVKLAVRVGLPVNVSAGRATRTTSRRTGDRVAA